MEKLSFEKMMSFLSTFRLLGVLTRLRGVLGVCLGGRLPLWRDVWNEFVTAGKMSSLPSFKYSTGALTPVQPPHPTVLKNNNLVKS